MSTTQPAFEPISFTTDQCTIWPELATCTSATEASRILFGVKGMTAFITLRPDTVMAVRAFFGENHSDMVAWARAIATEDRDWFYFHAQPEHRATYQTMVRILGLPITVQLTLNRDFKDIATGFMWLRATPKRWTRFEAGILDALPSWPKQIHAKMIHDYAVRRMKDAERAAQPRQPRAGRYAGQYEVTAPDAPLPAFPGLPANVGKYQILVPSTDADLRAIGTAQGHCVGTRGMGYADKIRRGQVCIVALYRKGLSDGLCIEIALCDEQPRVLQAQGKAGRGPTTPEADVIDQLTATLQSSCGMDGAA